LKSHAASLVLGLAFLAGCGGDGASPTPAPPSPSAQPATELEISAWPSGRSGEKREWTLTCSPAGGSHPDPEGACAKLAALDRPFFRPTDVVCTEIYGGPAVAEVRGTHGGRSTEFEISRTNGCEIALWDRHAFLFPVQPASP
jgi:hypothetical protein